MKLAFIGDIHGKVNQMYEQVSTIEERDNLDLDAIIQVGDFHAIRNEEDLKFFQASEKYRSVGDFPLFYNKGEVPKKTYFIGGNHDNNHWHSEYPNGYELIKDLHYLGRSGVRNFNDINIGFISGNYSEKGFYGNKKRRKYNHFTKRDVDNLLNNLNSEEKVDIMVFHDWPSIRKLKEHIVGERFYNHNLEYVLKRNFGSQEIYDVIKKIKPKYVFAGHIHIPIDIEIVIDNSKIRFIALDKLKDLESSIYVLDTESLEVNKYLYKNNG
ncbi:MAG: metallophosphoesterase [Nanoarchaeota archaeon]